MNVPKITKVTILRMSSGPDRVILRFEGPSTYPALYAEEAPEATITTQRGFAQLWCDSMGLKVDETIDATGFFRPYSKGRG